MKLVKRVLALILVLATVMMYNTFSLGIGSNAATESYKQSLRNKGFPESYVTKLATIHDLYPNWQFEPIMVTELNSTFTWDYIIDSQYNPVDYNGQNNYKNLVTTDSYAPGEWASLGQANYTPYYEASNTNLYDSGWRQASRAAIEYFMDPRNFLNDTDIFMFEHLGYNADVHTVANLSTVTASSFMANIDCDGVSYAQHLVNVGSTYDISPIFLAGRIRQEQGLGTSPLVNGTLGTMLKTLYNYSGSTYNGSPIWGDPIVTKESVANEDFVAYYDGYYNFFNMGASGTGLFAIYYNAANEASAANPKWTTRAKAIAGGAKKVSEKYIDNYQASIYLQKFNVDPRSSSALWGQYMQNVSAPLTEGRSAHTAYESIGMLSQSHVFHIPVYGGMPTAVCADPANGNSYYSPSPMSAVTTYNVTTSVAAGNGTVTLADGTTSGQFVAGDYVSYTVTPATGYKVSKIVIYGTSQTILNSGGAATYSFPMEAYDATISVTFTGYTPGVYEITSLSSLNVRSAPVNGETLGYLSTGTRITALEIVNTYWAKFIYKGQIAYCSVNSSYATLVSSSTVAESDVIFDNENAVNWVQNSGLSATNVTLAKDSANNSYMQVVASASNDPQLNLNFASLGSLSADQYKYMVITARTTNTANTVAGMFLCAGSVTGPTPDSYVSWNWTADGSWRDYVIDLSAVSAWTGNANMIRFDYFEGDTAANSTLDVRSIKFYTSKPSTATVTTDKTNYNIGESITLNFSGLDSYLGTLQNQTPFAAIYPASSRPGATSAIMYTYVNTASGSLTFPTGATGGTSIENLPAGSYKAWIAYDANGTSGANNFNNAMYAGSDASYAFTVSENVTPSTYTVNTNIASGNGTVTLSGGATTGSYAAGTTVSYTVTPASGYKVAKIIIYGTSQTVLNNGGTAVYSFPMEAVNATISVTFEALSSGDTSVVEKIGTDIASGSNSAVIKEGTSVSATIVALQTKLGTASVTITKDGAAVDSSAVIGTGMVVSSGSITYTVVVKGDVDGDGLINIADASIAMLGLRGQTTLSNASKDAVKELSGNSGVLSILDVMAILNMI